MNRNQANDSKGRPLGCDYCSNYVYDEDEECYFCEADMDEDDVAKLMEGRINRGGGCPYFSLDNEYAVVNKQI